MKDEIKEISIINKTNEINYNCIFNMNENLLRLSVNDNIDEAKNEWFLIMTCERDINKENNNLAKCQHEIKNINYIYNIKNNITTICGSKCCKKFGFNLNLLENNILLKILIKNLLNNDYNIINETSTIKLLKKYKSGVLIYNDKIENQLIKYFTKKLETNKANETVDIKFDKLTLLIAAIKDLINNYNMGYLTTLYYNIKIELKIIKNIIKNKRIIIEELPNIKKSEENIIKIEKIIIEELLEENITKIEKDKIMWICRFCKLVKNQGSELFFNDFICFNCNYSYY